MSSEIRANTLKNRVGLSTINITNTGVVVSGVSTFSDVTVNGNVGIGSVIPAEKLDVAGHIKVDGGPVLENSSTLGDGLKITTSSGYVEVGAQNTNNAHFYTDRQRFYFNKRIIVDEGIIGSFNEDVRLHTDITEERIRIKNDTGFVGIGTNVPRTKLNVYTHPNTNTGGILVQNANYTSNLDKAYLIAGTQNWTGATTDWNTYGFQHKLKSDSGGTPRLTIDGSAGGGNLKELINFSTNGQVGIGTDDTSNANAAAGNLVIQGGNNTGISIISSGSNLGSRIYFGRGYSSSDNRKGQISYTHSDDSFRIATGATERFRIKSVGVGINTDPTSKLTVAGNSATAQIEIKRTNPNASGTVGVLNFTAMDGHSVANISAVGDGDNEGAHIVFRTTSAAGELSPFGGSTYDRLHIESSGNVTVKSSTNNQQPKLRIESYGEYGEIKADGNGSIIIDADPDFNANDSYIGFKVDGSMKSTINADGNFTFYNSAAAWNTIQRATDTHYIGLRIQETDGTQRMQVGVSGGLNNICNGAQQHDVVLKSYANLLLATNQTERLRITSDGVVTIGNQPKSWATAYKVLQVGAASLVGQVEGDGTTTNYSNNAYYDSSNNRWEYSGAASDQASQITLTDGLILFKTAAAGTANNALSWTETLRIDSAGDVEIMQGKNLTWVYAGGSTHRARIRALSNDELIFERGSSNSESLRIDGSGRVLIATDAATGASSNADDLKIGNVDSGSQRGITIGSAVAGGLRFADAGNDTAGGMVYYHGSDDMRFTVAGSERVRFTDFGNFREIIFPQQNSDTYVQRVYRSTVSANANSYTKFATVTGPSYGTHIKMSSTATIANVVTTADFEIKVGHSNDILVISKTLAYTNVTIKVISNNNQNFDLYIKRSGGHNTSTNSTFKVAIHPQLEDVVVFNSTVNYSGRTHEHTTSFGAFKITGTGGPDGNIVAAGSVTANGSKPFKIKHPLASLSATKDLVHAAIEGPQVDLIYRGKIELVDGTATINLDTKSRMTEGTFVLLNRDIQCFTTNETGWTNVKGSVSGNILTINAQDASCTDTISWMVVGERQDDSIKGTSVTDADGKLIMEPLNDENVDTSHLHKFYPNP